MKLSLSIVTILASSSYVHANLRGGRDLFSGFQQDLVMAAVNDPNRIGPHCTLGEYTQETFIELEKKQFPTQIPVADQCWSACDCRGRCCSNWWYYIDYLSHKEGINTMPGDLNSGFAPGLGVEAVGRSSSMEYPVGGGVCVEASEDFTWALEDPTCQFGIYNMIQAAGSDSTEVEVDLGEIVIDTPLEDFEEPTEAEGFVYKKEKLKTCKWLASIGDASIIKEICSARVVDPSASSVCPTTCKGGLGEEDVPNAVYLHRAEVRKTCDWLEQRKDKDSICASNDDASSKCTMVCM